MIKILYLNVSVIQKKGLVLIQLLGDSAHVFKNVDLCRELAKVTVEAMTTYKDVPGVQSEVWMLFSLGLFHLKWYEGMPDIN